MAHPVDASRSKGRSPLAQWFHQTIEIPVRTQFRLRGNSLYILCEGLPQTERIDTLIRLVKSLKHTDLNKLVPVDQPQIYQISLDGRVAGQNRPEWTFTIHLNQLDQHLEALLAEKYPPAPESPPEEQHPSQPVPLEPAPVVPEFSTLPSKLAEPVRKSSAAKSSPNSGSGISGRTSTVLKPPVSAAKRSAIAISNRSLAKQGQPDAIARYLSETLSAQGVAVKVHVKASPYSSRAATSIPAAVTAIPAHPAQRLWITCEAAYSPSPSLIAEPIAKLLRDLQLEGYRDALTSIQVQGEAKPDWVLRVDLTPPEEMLREWARWGDVEAITRLVNRALVESNIHVATASLKEATLHLSFSYSEKSQVAVGETAPNQEAINATVGPLLATLAPQGIHAATVYGQVPGQEAPAWVNWLNLPAAEHPALAESTLDLAKQGDRPAIAFLLSRLLNPDLDQQLATGGIRLQVLLKQDLLHIMSDAPVCPQQQQVGSAIARFLRPLEIPGITGVRVYGRRSGQKRPRWSYGADFNLRDRLVPEAAPEFAATDAYVGDLITRSDDLIIRPDLTPTDIQTAWTKLRQEAVQAVQQTLLRSQFFIPQEGAALHDTSPARQVGIALVWGAVGLLLMVQADWMLGRVLQSAPASVVEARSPELLESPDLPVTPPVAASPDAVPPASTLPTVAVDAQADAAEPSPAAGEDAQDQDAQNIFDTSSFVSAATQANPESIEPNRLSSNLPSNGSANLPSSDPAPLISPDMALTFADGSPYPTFNSQQFDQKIALYHQRLVESGPPDVLVIGSSRALRGVDPEALRRSLAELGYSDIEIFNFGVNGATAQVVNLILQQMLTPDQLPKLLLWADGARAFNSGGVDVTYDGIVASEGYRQMISGALPSPTSSSYRFAGNGIGVTPQAGGIAATLTANYQAFDRWLSQRVGTVSTVYQERDRLKSLFQQQVSTLLPETEPITAIGVMTETEPLGGEQQNSPQTANADSQGLMDFDGFLPLSIQFNPATYYQEYARVPGDYDNDYESFRIAGNQAEALQSLLQFTQSRSIPIVFVNLPLSQEYLDPVRAGYEQEFKQYMLELSVSQPGFIFRDLGQLWLEQHAYFSDPSHLNRYGAYEVSKRLAQDPLIPWANPAQALE
ncbi:DUF1574 domain-containing protein [Leptolyngbya sp. FACHB-671]|uniref:DUF1574 domain-containing protein n=1 Tax=Leptolyngbya sp. FACHB-671 TaxID=2692812 RepID=UPI001688C80F|nr:DUF1574 domain-containing protein [Leptolyngbya sp. FACHB-671]MBD2067837.1 DUF1574 domain-containing protein [Leptolyngbya sp. FACHB-671]